jgi:hypothetical protein
LLDIQLRFRVQISAQMDEAETICFPSGLKFVLEALAVCPTKVCRQLPAKSQSLRLLSHEAETICLAQMENRLSLPHGIRASNFGI